MMDNIKEKDIIFAKDLRKMYGDFTAVDSISFSVNSGECVGFLGPNGAGKTTLMRMIFSLNKKTSGDLLVFGKNPIRDRKGINTYIGVVFQENNLDEELNVIGNLHVFSKYYGIDTKTANKRIDELLDLMQISSKRDCKVRELSGGMIRRLMIARALLNAPKILILDEPTTGLDPQVRLAIWSVLRELKRQGITILLTTHYMDEAQQLADRVIIMNKGKVLLQGLPSQLIKENLEIYVLQASGLLETPKSIAADIRHEKIGDSDYFYSNSEELLIDLKHKLYPHEVVLRYANLEDVFLKCTGRSLENEM